MNRNGQVADGRLKVALVGAYPTATDRIANGVEAVVVYLKQGLASMPEVELTIVSPRLDVDHVSRSDEPGCTVHFLPASRRLGNLSLGIPDKWRVVQVLKAIAPDVVHVHNHALYPFIYSSPLFPTVTTVHGFVSKEVRFEHEGMDSVRKFPRLFLETVVFQRVRHVIAVSEYVGRLVREKSRALVSVIDNPVDGRFFQLHSQEVVGRILFAGTITRRKNLLGLLKAVALLRPQLPNIDLRIAGAFTEPTYAEEVRGFVAENSLRDAVSFLGHLSEAELVKEYSTCQVVASASHEETAGMIFQQAMAAGKPVVSTRTSGIPDIVSDGRSGLLVDPGNVQALADALRLLLQRTELRRQMGAWGRQEAERRFRPEVVARQTCDVYRSLLSAN